MSQHKVYLRRTLKALLEDIYGRSVTIHTHLGADQYVIDHKSVYVAYLKWDWDFHIHTSNRDALLHSIQGYVINEFKNIFWNQASDMHCKEGSPNEPA